MIDRLDLASARGWFRIALAGGGVTYLDVERWAWCFRSVDGDGHVGPDVPVCPADREAVVRVGEVCPFRPVVVDEVEAVVRVIVELHPAWYPRRTG